MKIVCYLLLLLQGLAVPLQPVNNISFLNIHEMYEQCSVEDHDITPLDFVFEHVLNFECLINYFEGEEEEEHQPFQTVKISAPVDVTIPEPFSICFTEHSPATKETIYSFFYKGHYSSSHLSDILRPPIVI